MNIIMGILAFIPLLIALASAYYCGVILEEYFDIHNIWAIGILSIAFGVLVWWVLVQYILPAIGIALGLDKITYVP